MLRKYTLTALIALSIAASPIAAPTAVAKDNVDRFLIGLAAIGIAGVIANEVNKDKRQDVANHKPHYTGTHKPRQTYTHTPKFKKQHHQHRHGNVVHSHKLKKGHNHVAVKPRQCLRQKWTQNGWVKFYSQPCLRNYQR